MSDTEEQKQHIERAINAARDGVSNRIDELDRRLRTDLDPKNLASTYATPLIAGGAVLGLLVGFGMPKVFRRVITWGVPLAILAVTIKNARNGAEAEEPIEY